MQTRILFLSLLLSALVFGVVMCTQNAKETFGFFDHASDVGECKIPGTFAFDSDSCIYRIGGSGQNMWFKEDNFHFVYKKMSGDFILTAQFQFVGDGVEAHRKTGWMVRKTLDANSPYADAVVHGDGLTSLQFRRDFDLDTEEAKSDVMAPDVLQLEKSGDAFVMRAAKLGDPLRETEVVHVSLGDSFYVGLAICSHNEKTFEQAVVSNVRIEIPAPQGFVPYQDFGGSRLEVMDVATGLRKIVYESADPLEAPNWTRDGKALIYNSKGLLYKFDLNAGEPQQINTDFAIHNNNDHVISFDGKRMAISNHVQGESGGGSTIFTLPIEGGKPTRVTQKTPSYLHGWSLDGKYLIYTAQRNGQYDIYRISVDGGEEVQLTNQPTLDDGPEYSPNGEWIYFNSARTGVMQIWRMKPDGSRREQLTFDAFNDWFPHVSPDGQSVLFLSYPSDVDAQDHPHYKHVMLRLMPFEGGEPRAVAYLYGGQGSINVPSWSPDSKKVAFVSYSF